MTPRRELLIDIAITEPQDVTRREFMFSALGAALLIACGDDSDDDSDGAGDGWSFTDDRGVTVSLPSRPKRIVAQEDAAAALWSFGIRPVAVYGNAPLSENPQFVDEDLSEVESVGEVFGELDLEKLISLKADLVVTTLWPTQGAAGGGFEDEAQEKRVNDIAPIVAIEAPVAFRGMVGRYRDLAGALGADLTASEVANELKALDESLNALSAAAKKAPGLKVLAVAGALEELYVANPEYYSDLKEYAAAGLSFVTPENTSDFDGLWELLSWEQANKYAADVILYDARAGAFGESDLNGVATWRTLPAVVAKQTGSWYVGTTYRLSFFTEHVRQLTALIEKSRKVI